MFDFTTSTGEIRQWLSRCAGLIDERYPVYPGLYTEMNGFDINTDRWFASLDPLAAAPGLDPHTWEAMDVVPFPPVLVLTGADAMQDAFRRWPSMPKSPIVDREVALAQRLVWAKWLVLFQAAWLEGPVPQVRVPIIATAHDFDVALLLAPHPQASSVPIACRFAARRCAVLARIRILEPAVCRTWKVSQPCGVSGA
jgi:hypothetical protein